MKGSIHYTKRHFWTPEEITTAALIYQRLLAQHSGTSGFVSMAVGVIARRLGLPVSTVTNRRRNYGTTFDGDHKQPVGAAISSKIPATVFAEREARAAAADRRTMTQVFFGDPPPGYSALDRRR